MDLPADGTVEVWNVVVVVVVVNININVIGNVIGNVNSLQNK